MLSPAWDSLFFIFILRYRTTVRTVLELVPVVLYYCIVLYCIVHCVVLYCFVFVLASSTSAANSTNEFLALSYGLVLHPREPPRGPTQCTKTKGTLSSPSSPPVLSFSSSQIDQKNTDHSAEYSALKQENSLESNLSSVGSGQLHERFLFQ